MPFQSEISETPGVVADSLRKLDPERTITIVSGLPRSGTSAMMQMLKAAGLSVASDRERHPDEDNPKGYFELEAVKRLREDASFLEEVVGQALKVVAPLLPSLVPDFDYRIVFMERDLDEVLASQRVMLKRQSRSEDGVSDAAMKRAFSGQLDRVKEWMEQSENVTCLFVSHRDLIEQPREVAQSVANFLARSADGFDPPHRFDEDAVARMAATVDPDLFRQRVAR